MNPLTIPYDPSRQALLFPGLGAGPALPTETFPTDAQLCAEAARLAYKAFESNPAVRAEVAGFFGSLGFETFDFLDEADTQAFLARSSQHDLAILAFRGTEQKVGDFATDLAAQQVPWSRGGRVHKGFAHALSIALPHINHWLAGPPVGRRLFTGHSLGAALAILAATLPEARSADGLYTFGAPRVGNADFAGVVKASGIKAFRYVDCCDIVCRLPPEQLSFEHVGQLIYIDQTGALHPDADADFIRADQSDAREKYILEHSWQRGTVAVRDLADHTPLNYVSAVWGLR